MIAGGLTGVHVLVKKIMVNIVIVKNHYSKTRKAKVLISYCPVVIFRYCAKLPKNSQTIPFNSKEVFLQGAVPSTGTVIPFNNYCC